MAFSNIQCRALGAGSDKDTGPHLVQEADVREEHDSKEWKWAQWGGSWSGHTGGTWRPGGLEKDRSSSRQLHHQGIFYAPGQSAPVLTPWAGREFFL